eukprot:3023738-Prymnesium_polylepis.1
MACACSRPHTSCSGLRTTHALPHAHAHAHAHAHVTSTSKSTSTSTSTSTSHMLQLCGPRTLVSAHYNSAGQVDQGIGALNQVKCHSIPDHTSEQVQILCRPPPQWQHEQRGSRTSRSVDFISPRLTATVLATSQCGRWRITCSLKP